MSEKNFKINFCPVVLEPGWYRGIQGYTGQNSTILTIFAVGQCESKFSIFKVTRFGCLRARRPLRWWSSVLLIFSMTLESEAWNHRIVGVKVSRVFEKIYSTTVFLQFFTLNFFSTRLALDILYAFNSLTLSMTWHHKKSHYKAPLCAFRLTRKLTNPSQLPFSWKIIRVRK